MNAWINGPWTAMKKILQKAMQTRKDNPTWNCVICFPQVDEDWFHDFINENIERVRKLSFSLQLSDHDDYKGGQLQLMNEVGETYFAPKKKGTLIIFDSRVRHRVRKVTEGERQSLVGWVMGPRWR